MFDDDARRQRRGENCEVFPLARRMQICRGGAATFAVFLRHLEQAAAVLFRAVEVGIERNSGLLRGLDEQVTERIGVRTLRDIERTFTAVERIGQTLVALGELEER